MSVILLTSPPWLLDDVKTRDEHAQLISDTSAILATKDAIVCKQTLDTIYSKLFPTSHAHLSSCARTMHEIEDGVWLRIVHDTNVMGPARFLNVGNGAYTAPWGLWTLYKGDPSFSKTEPLDMTEAVGIYRKAQQFTYNFSAHNQRMANFLNYMQSEGKWREGVSK